MVYNIQGQQALLQGHDKGNFLVKLEQRLKLANFLKKGHYLIWPVEGRFFTELTQLFWQTCWYYAIP